MLLLLLMLHRSAHHSDLRGHLVHDGRCPRTEAAEAEEHGGPNGCELNAREHLRPFNTRFMVSRESMADLSVEEASAGW